MRDSLIMENHAVAGDFAPIKRPEKYSREELESFVNGVIRASSHMKEVYEKIGVDSVRNQKEFGFPYYIVSLHGCLPLFDILTIVDASVDTDRAVYLPGSSKIQNSRDVLRNCFENFLREKEDETAAVTPLLSLDEVVGGHSVERLFKSYETALRRVARHHLEGSERRKGDIEEVAHDLREQFPLRVMGIRDMRCQGRKLSNEYLQRVEESLIIEVPVKKIITMDDPDYQVVEFDHPRSSGWTPALGYFPSVSESRRTRVYEELLKDIARYVGADPDRINLERARISSDCAKYARKPLH